MLRVTTEINSPLGGYPAYNSLFFDAEGATAAQTVATRVSDFWNAVKMTIADLVTFSIETEVAQITPSSGDISNFWTVSAPPAQGTLPQEILPPITQALIRLRTTTVLNNRKVQGRIFVPGLPESTNTNGQPTASARGVLTNAAQALQLSSAGGALVVWHRPTNGAGGSIAPVTSIDVWEQWASLRSRRD